MATATKLTLDQFLALPDTKPASEYADGEAVQKPMPDNPHALLQLYMGVVLFQFLSRTPLGRVRTEWRCIFGPPGYERVFVPDLTYASHERAPRGDARRNRVLRAAPDLAIEILSPDQHAGRFADKIRFYLMHGVRLVWVIDPDAETVLVLAPDAESRTLRPGDILDGGDVLPGFSVPVAEIFAQLQV